MSFHYLSPEVSNSENSEREAEESDDLEETWEKIIPYCNSPTQMYCNVVRFVR